MSAPTKLIVIGTSTGGIAALQTLLGGLPPDFPAAIMITMHLGDNGSVLPELLAPYCKLHVRFARDKELVVPGVVLVAPPNKHLLLDQGRVNLVHGAKENYSRPAIDPFFRSAAISHRRHAIGVVLTGDLDDGTVGLQAIKACGGLAIVQDPSEAEAPSMPSSALQYVDPHYCLPVRHIIDQLLYLLGQAPDDRANLQVPVAMSVENQLCLEGGLASIEQMDEIAERSVLSCPECHGALWEMSQKPLRYRCHTGHAYTALTMRDSQDEVLEEAIWGVLRALQEKKTLLKRLHQDALAEGHEQAALSYSESVEQLSQHAEILRKLVGE
jgi:two-component system chemotaxis response regulator CheB